MKNYFPVVELCEATFFVFFFPVGILIAAQMHSVLISLHPCKQIDTDSC